MNKPVRLLLIIAVAVAAGLSLIASSAPDGLERVLVDAGVGERAVALLPSPAPDYQIPGLGDGALATALAGVLGTLLTLCVAWGIGRLLTTRRANGQS